MKLIAFVVSRAKTSPFYLWLLNRLLWRLIPFNKPHKVTIQSLTNSVVIIRLPYRRANMNHLKGMHAFALGTLCEYACGIGLMTTLDPKQYRIILKEVKIDYKTQAKEDVFARFETTQDLLEHHILQPLSQHGSVVHTFIVKAYTAGHKEICTGEITWQLKHWDKVKK